ncbi:MAG: hypothetical protein JRI71_04415 [Deltaproteobacteria bacterium]|nr:hypothetical protein [Deltaproteobacteria bacterium]
MTPHFDFWLQQPKAPGKPIGQIRVRILTGDEDKGTNILMDDIRSEDEIDKNIDILIEELETIRKEAKRKLKKQISMLKK